MIKLNRLNNEPFYVNDDRIEHIELTPNTMLCFESGRKVIVLESAEQVIDLICQYKERVSQYPANKIVSGRGEELCQ